MRALVGLRWRTVREPAVRAGLLLALAAVAALALTALLVTPLVPTELLVTLRTTAPAAYLGFAVLAVVAPLAAEGGTELFPPEQLVPHPVSPATVFGGGLLLTPLNVVWVVQLTGLLVVTSALATPGALLPGLLTATAYALALTLLGHALAWLLVGVRRTSRGRAVVRLLLVTVAAAVVTAGSAGLLLDVGRSRAADVLPDTVLAGARGDLGGWLPLTAGLGLAAALAGLLGIRACGWSLRRSGDATSTTDRPLRRRRPAPTAYRALVAVDRASAWRAPAVRRGGAVLAALPVLAVLAVPLPWSSVVVLPGLVCAASGLLVGVNLFALDGGGATWLASLPLDPRRAALAKAQVLAETCLAGGAAVVVVGALRAPDSADRAEVAAAVLAVLCGAALVVADGLRRSVRRPHRADLAGPRDAIAPPAALAAASARLATKTTLVGFLLAGAAAPGPALLPVVVGLPVLLACAWSVRRSVQRYALPQERARVVATVSAG